MKSNTNMKQSKDIILKKTQDSKNNKVFLELHYMAGDDDIQIVEIVQTELQFKTIFEYAELECYIDEYEKQQAILEKYNYKYNRNDRCTDEEYEYIQEVPSDITCPGRNCSLDKVMLVAYDKNGDRYESRLL